MTTFHISRLPLDAPHRCEITGPWGRCPWMALMHIQIGSDHGLKVCARDIDGVISDNVDPS